MTDSNEIIDELVYELEQERLAAVRKKRLHTLVGVECFSFGMIDRVYGSPEEGGWYYTHFEPIRYFYIPKRSADRFAARLEKLHGTE